MRGGVRAESVLNLVLWGAGKLIVPTWHNLFESYEGWEYRTRLRHQLRRLENQQLLQRERQAQGIVYCVTESGRLAACGGRDPGARWDRPWDGCWRMILFDLPAGHQRVRFRLWRWLRENHFGYLQNSVWICPDPIPRVMEALKPYRDDVESFTVMEARCSAGVSDRSIVDGAWDFPEINRRYQGYIATVRVVGSREGGGLASWLRREREAWSYAVSADPLLPRSLLPKGYLGIEAWRARARALKLASRQLTTQS